MGRLGDEAKGTETVLRGLEVILRFRRSFRRAHDIFSVVAATINLTKKIYTLRAQHQKFYYFFFKERNAINATFSTISPFRWKPLLQISAFLHKLLTSGPVSGYRYGLFHGLIYTQYFLRIQQLFMNLLNISYLQLVYAFAIY